MYLVRRAHCGRQGRDGDAQNTRRLGAFPASRLFPTPILATTELTNAWLRDSVHPETDVEAVFLHSRSSQRRRRPMAYGPSKRPSVDRDEPITPTQSA
ncbi:predicted protein [Pyrenophora tritici-repentis Pt-1C-BFP]|uniref:Uncharacterized protein n=1 Tax=Pyrenophora tritici-repentis (strain Pt-1C-BFP) TaxID=426418 RepID=B2WP29_PYRTR|nr:uncharacterized protein PTRG_11739 [Pyrenophora tritici-repentis Pt-1C-BFP]EDU44789.1 predicted protein [Pyrenophora tritici-repentis Pt-1C-BFP]